MSTSRGDARVVRRHAVAARAMLLAGGVGAATAACTPQMRAMRQHPSPLAGVWLDSARTVPGDTALWRLAQDGEFHPFRVRVRMGSGGVSDERFAPEHGLWYLRGRLEDADHRRLCLHDRRIATYCVPFTLDTLAGGTRRLRLGAYHREFAVSARTLLERAR